MMIDVIYLAAGQGKRVGLGYPKQFARLGGKPIMIHGLEVLRGMKEIDNIIVTAPAGQLGETWEVVKAYFGNDTPDVYGIEGGGTRQESVCKALKEIRTEYVLVTEAVRPFITADFVRQIINIDGVLVTPCFPAVSSVVTRQGTFLHRGNVGEVQMPQKFLTDLLRNAHARAIGNHATCDGFLVWDEMGIGAVVISGREENIKITTPLDLVIAEAMYNAKYTEQE